MKKTLFILSLIAQVFVFAQKQPAFQGRLIYQIEFINPVDSTQNMISKSIIYTNDTLVRVESETGQLGPQVLIKHLILQKYYLLINYNDTKFAIQQHVPPDTVPSKYTFKKKLGSKKIASLKAKRVIVNAKSFDKPLEMWYYPKISPKYLDVLKGIKGLPVDYYIQMEDGILHYTLQKIEFSEVNKDLFGIPSDFKKVSFDEFLDQMIQLQLEIKE
jgi:hypothetical protein